MQTQQEEGRSGCFPPSFPEARHPHRMALGTPRMDIHPANRRKERKREGDGGDCYVVVLEVTCTTLTHNSSIRTQSPGPGYTQDTEKTAPGLSGCFSAVAPPYLKGMGEIELQWKGRHLCPSRISLTERAQLRELHLLWSHSGKVWDRHTHISKASLMSGGCLDRESAS